MFKFNMAPDYATMTPEEVIARRKRLADAMASRRTAPTAVEGLAQIAVALINNKKDKKLAGREAELREQAVADAEAWLGGMGGGGTGYGGGYATTYSDKSQEAPVEPENAGPKLSFGSGFEAANTNVPNRKALYPVGVDASNVKPTPEFPLGVDATQIPPMGWAAGLTSVPGNPTKSFGGGQTAGGGATGSYALPADPVVEGFKAAHLAKGAPAVTAPTPPLDEPPVEGFKAAHLANGGLRVPAPVEAGTAISPETSAALSGFFQEAIKKPEGAGRERIAEALSRRGGRGRSRGGAPVVATTSSAATPEAPALSFGRNPEPAPAAAPVDPKWEAIKNGIFAGESGGDYDALFGFQNRAGGKYEGVKLTEMTVDQALDFANPRGEYGQWVKGQVGRVATPMGAYQIVGTTLRAAKDGLGLKGDEVMTPELQDQMGKWILAQQGTGAWEGYRGPAEAPEGGWKPGGVAMSTKGGGGYAGSGYGSGAGGRSVAGLAALLANPLLPDSYKAILGSIYEADVKAASPSARDSVVVGDMLVDRATGQVIADYSGSGSGTGGSDKPMTESQTKLYLFSNIQSQVTPLINSLEDAGFNPANAPDYWGNGVLDTSFFVSQDGQKYNSAAASWAAAALRVETGAAATPSEIKAMQERYFAVPGDTQETIATKRKLREGYENVLKTALGGDKNAMVAPVDFGTPAPGGNPTGNGKTVVQYDSNGNRVK